MAVEEKVICLNLLAGADLSSHQYKIVYLSAAKTVSLQTTAGAGGIGILQNEPAASGRSAQVAISGRVKALAGAVVAAGVKVTNDATGRIVTAQGDDEVLGESVIAGAAAGDVMEVVVSQQGRGTVPLRLVAADNYSAKQYYLGYVDSSGEVALPGDGATFHGVVQTATAAAGTADFAYGGPVPCIAGDTVTAGDDIASDSAGRGIPATALDYVGGVALTGATVGNAFTILLLPGLARTGENEVRVPSNVETAAFTAAVNATWEDEDVVALFNAQTTTDIETSKAIHFWGVMEIINSEAVPHTAKWADGGTPDNDDKVIQYAVSAAIGSDFQDVDLYTDASGQIKIEVDDITKITMKLHLRGYRYVQNTAIT